MKAQQKQRPEQYTVRIGGDLGVQLGEYMDANGFTSPSEAIREILAVYFASNPVDAVVMAARYNAVMQAKHWILTRMQVTLHELQQEMSAQVISIEKSGYGK